MNILTDETQNYIEQKENRIKTFLRLRFGIQQIGQKPYLLLCVFMPVALFLALWYKLLLPLFQLQNAPEFLRPIAHWSVVIIAPAMAAVSLALWMLEQIGERNARRDEAKLIVAFPAKDLRKGYPLLVNRRKIKGGLIAWEFYTNIPMEAWVKSGEAIADAINVHFVEPFAYGGKGKRSNNGKLIRLVAAPGRKPQTRGDICDDI